MFFPAYFCQTPSPAIFELLPARNGKNNLGPVGNISHAPRDLAGDDLVLSGGGRHGAIKLQAGLRGKTGSDWREGAVLRGQSCTRQAGALQLLMILMVSAHLYYRGPP